MSTQGYYRPIVAPQGAMHENLVRTRPDASVETMSAEELDLFFHLFQRVDEQCGLPLRKTAKDSP